MWPTTLGTGTGRPGTVPEPEEAVRAATCRPTSAVTPKNAASTRSLRRRDEYLANGAATTCESDTESPNRGRSEPSRREVRVKHQVTSSTIIWSTDAALRCP